MIPDSAITDLAKKAAAIDHREGGHRAGLNIAAWLAWGAEMKADHGRCGQLAPVRGDDGHVTGITCPVHGFQEAPEWKAPT